MEFLETTLCLYLYDFYNNDGAYMYYLVLLVGPKIYCYIILRLHTISTHEC